MKISFKHELHYPLILAKRILVILWLYAIARIFFYIVNQHLFTSINVWGLLKCEFYGLRFDLCAIAYTNLLFILLHILPFFIRDKRWYQLICKVLFYLVNGSLFIIMISDAEYYQFSLRHGTTELLDFMFDFFKLLPAYLLDFWYLTPISIVILLLTEFFYRKTKRKIKSTDARELSFRTQPKRHFLIQLLIVPFIIGITFLMIRGGFQKYPLAPIHAGKHVPPAWTPVVINTPFSIIHSFFHPKLTPLHYFEEKELAEHFTYLKQPINDSILPFDSGEKENIFIIIMESFSAEYTGLYNSSSTPFLDSLSKNSLSFTQMYANGMRSIDGIPAILAGIPSQNDEGFLSSIYQSNQYKGTAGYLKEMGYATSYFHGGHNGTFNLDNFALASGFENYIGKNEYKGDKKDDSHWGIYDEPFFKFTVKEVGNTKQPFLAALFSLSSHHPYEVPEEYKKQHPQHPIPLLNSVQYADYALKEFFKAAEKKDWFKHTLFIITADHCGPALSEKTTHNINRLHVPLIFYHPTDSFFRGKNNMAVQHIDIMPTILDYVHYPKPYYSFGEGIFRNNSHFSYGYVGGNYYVMDGKYVLERYDEKPTALYEINEARNFDKNLLDQYPDIVNKLSNKSKAFLQTYVNALIENKMIY